MGGGYFREHDRNKKQILIIGYYGSYNFGDELMLKLLLEEFSSSETEISVVFTKNKGYDYSQWENIFAYTAPDNPIELEKATDFFDEVILGGGAHIDDRESDSLRFIPYLIIEITKLMIKKGKIVRWLGGSSNKELRRTSYIDDLKFIAPKITEFTVWDEYSINTLRKEGIPTDNIKLVEDIAFGIGRTTKILCVTLIDFYGDRDKIVSIVNEAAEFARNSKEDWVICFLPFYNEGHNDIILIDSVVKNSRLDDVKYFVAQEYGNVESMLAMIKGCDLFLNMRYHASLISMLFKKPTISIAYDAHPHYYNKMTQIHKTFNSEHYLIYITEYKSGDVCDRLIEATLRTS